jgi:endoglucanase
MPLYRRALIVVSVVLAGAVPALASTACARDHRDGAPVARGLPRVTGAAQEGHRLHAVRGHWAGASGFAYRWLRCDAGGRHCFGPRGAAARGSTYVLGHGDVGRRMRVKVIARNRQGSSSAVSWHATGVVRGAPSTTAGQGAGASQRALAGPVDGRAGLHVSGNKMLDTGVPVHLHGVNRAGTEYACVQGYDIFDGPSDAASVAAIRAWNANIVRIPLNEDCWLGINGVPAAYSGRNYIDAIVRYVDLLHQHGMYAELSLMWAAPGSYPATYQSGSPDADHSPAMWASMARTFKDDPGVILAPWGETVVDADCFLHGGVCEATFGPDNTPYATAGMQQAVDVMRASGYAGVIAIPGIDFANNMSAWLQHMPSDPSGQLIAEMHLYGKNSCGTVSCLDTTVAPILAAGHPVLLGETGETFDASSCEATNISAFLTWADQHGVGYEPWAWNTWGDCSALISDYDGTPANAYGASVKAHFAGLGQSGPASGR